MNVFYPLFISGEYLLVLWGIAVPATIAFAVITGFYFLIKHVTKNHSDKNK